MARPSRAAQLPYLPASCYRDRNMLMVSDILGPTGRIAARLEQYEHRPQQLEMADAVERALVDGHHLIVEAGTGIGKSFAYLVPAILSLTSEEKPSSDESRRRIIISTHTISLQEQLLSKDIPLLNSVIPREFTAILVKGRRNYLSRRRLGIALERSRNLFSDHAEVEELEQIRDWTGATHDGSVSDLAKRPLAPGLGRSCK